jgi:alpha-L-rhamnosidase
MQRKQNWRNRVRYLRQLCAFIALVFLAPAALATPVHLRCEYRNNPLGIDARTPHLSWQSDNTERNWKQSAYEILVASSHERLDSGHADVWDSGNIQSDDSVGIAYNGPALESRRRYYWKVRVWDAAGHPSESAGDAWWEMGLLHSADWTAKWIYRNNPDDGADRSGIRWIWVQGQDPLATTPGTTVKFRTSLTISRKPQNADFFIAIHGAYKATVNGREVGSKSRWDAFDRRDIADELVIGKNAIEVDVSNPLDDDAKTTVGGFAALLKITNADGSILRFPTDQTWQARLKNNTKWDSAKVAGDLTDNRFRNPGPLPQPASYFRRTFESAKAIRRARLYVTALGSYRVFLNGNRVGADVLTPGYTDFRKRVMYQTYDVTNQITSGANVIAALLGDGWYASPLTWNGAYFFKPPDRFFAQLELEYAEGSRNTISSDGSWKAAASPILAAQIYSGEFYDARLDAPGWNTPNFNDSAWTPALVGDAPPAAVTSQIDPTVRVIAKLQPKSVSSSKNGAYVFDMGQNMVGWATLKVKGAAGTKVRMRFAERLNPDGTVYTENLRNADATDTYILRGGGEEFYTPQLTFHGFRYVEITGYPGTPGLDAIKGEVASSVDDKPTGILTTSSELVNRMWQIGLWGQRGNFLSVPTDCPQRDERLGWMGDAEVFWRTGAYNFDIAAFSQKFIQDITDAQTSDGGFTNISPNTMPADGGGVQDSSKWNEDMVGAPGWGDAGVIVPWTTWLQYGDKSVIEKNWDAMRRWMEFIQSRNLDFIRKKGVGPNFSDWLAPDSDTDKDLLATAYWALIANMMSQMAHATGNDADAKRYDGVVQNIRTAFQKAYIKDDGTVGTGTQTSYVVALNMKLAPAALEPQLTGRLVKDIQERNWHLSTGFLGTPFLLFTLADHGRTDVAYRLLLNDTYPSWGYMLSKGATTWWERWNGDTGDPSMNSYNHYAFGSVMAWVYRYAAGIDTSIDAPGFKQIVIHPRLDSKMPAARAEYDSIYGKIVSDWKGIPAGPFSLKVVIPANTAARVFLPAIPGAHVTEGGNPIETQTEGGQLLVRVGSGTYNFDVSQ